VEWSVRVELAGDARTLDPDTVSDVLESLETNAAVGSLGSRALGLRLAVEADDALAAGTAALKLVRNAMSRAGLPEWPVVGVGTETMTDLTRDLERPNFTRLAGVTELGAMLGVSKQRASELARSRSFPKPLTTLASGPVWSVAAVKSFARTWTRRPGPKPVMPNARSAASAKVVPAKVARSGTSRTSRAKAGTKE
jgi:hypothetical protein